MIVYFDNIVICVILFRSRRSPLMLLLRRQLLQHQPLLLRPPLPPQHQLRHQPKPLFAHSQIQKLRIFSLSTLLRACVLHLHSHYQLYFPSLYLLVERLNQTHPSPLPQPPPPRNRLKRPKLLQLLRHQREAADGAEVAVVAVVAVGNKYPNNSVDNKNEAGGSTK